MAKTNVWLLRIATNKPLHDIAAAVASVGLRVEHIQLQQGKSPAAPTKNSTAQGSLPLTKTGKSSPAAAEQRFAAMKRRRDHAVEIIMGILKDRPSITMAELADELNANHPTATTRYHTPWSIGNVEAYYWDAFDRLTTKPKE